MISYKTAERVINPVRSIGDFTVTPEVAEYWLEQYNVHNRSLKWDHIAAMAGAIQRGEWVYNATPISFGVLDDGQVFQVDGQHRCYAIVKAGLPVPSAVATGLEAKAQDYIDIGRHRHYADQLQLAGIPNTKATAAVVRAIWIYRAYEQVGNKFKITPTHAQLEHLRLELMPALLVDIDRALRVSRAIKGPMGVYGLASHLFTVKDPAMAAEFFEGLEKGADLRARHPILILRDRLRDNASAKAKLNEEEIAAIIFKAWNHFRDGRDVGALRWRATGPTPEAFPVPQ